MSNPFVVGPSTSETASQSLPTFKEFAWDFEKDDFIYQRDGSHEVVPEKKLSRSGCCMYSDVNGTGILHTLTTTVSSLKNLSVQARMMGSGVLSFSAM